jgi:transcription termination factor Rho
VFGDLPNPSRFNDLAALDALAVEVSAGTDEPIWLNVVYAKTLAELTAFARQLGVSFEGAPNKRQLLNEIFKFAVAQRRTLRDVGHIDQNDRGSFVVHEHVNYRLSRGCLPAGLARQALRFEAWSSASRSRSRRRRRASVVPPWSGSIA